MNEEKDIFKKTEGVLFNYNIIKAEIHNLMIEIDEIKDEYDGVGAISYEEKSGPTNKIGDSVAAEVMNKDRMICSLQRAIRSKERLLAKIKSALGSLDETELKFVEYRYLDNSKRSWNQVGALMNLDPNYCCNFIRPAVINKLSNLIFIRSKNIDN